MSKINTQTGRAIFGPAWCFIAIFIAILTGIRGRGGHLQQLLKVAVDGIVSGLSSTGVHQLGKQLRE